MLLLLGTSWTCVLYNPEIIVHTAALCKEIDRLADFYRGGSLGKGPGMIFLQII